MSRLRRRQSGFVRRLSPNRADARKRMQCLTDRKGPLGRLDRPRASRLVIGTSTANGRGSPERTARPLVGAAEARHPRRIRDWVGGDLSRTPRSADRRPRRAERTGAFHLDRSLSGSVGFSPTACAEALAVEVTWPWCAEKHSAAGSRVGAENRDAKARRRDADSRIEVQTNTCTQGAWVCRTSESIGSPLRCIPSNLCSSAEAELRCTTAA